MPSQNLEDSVKSAALITGYFSPGPLHVGIRGSSHFHPAGFQRVSWFRALMLHWTGSRASACNYSGSSVNRWNKSLLAKSKTPPAKILRGSRCASLNSAPSGRVNTRSLPVCEPKPVQHLNRQTDRKTSHWVNKILTHRGSCFVLKLLSILNFKRWKTMGIKHFVMQVD